MHQPKQGIKTVIKLSVSVKFIVTILLQKSHVEVRSWPYK